MEIREIAEFLETNRLSFTFTFKGLKYLALRGNGGEETVELRTNIGDENPNRAVLLLLQETSKFLETGKHDLVLDFRGFTDFQRAVFKEVLKTNPGDILTYGALAAAMGKPKAARAVGQALSKNPVAYFIPTHRVLPQKGLGRCLSGAGFLREKLLSREGHNLKILARRDRA